MVQRRVGLSVFVFALSVAPLGCGVSKGTNSSGGGTIGSSTGAAGSGGSGNTTRDAGGPTDTSADTQPIQKLVNVISLSAGGAHACAVVQGGATYCWGDNSIGELGSNAGSYSNVPVAVTGVSAAMVSTGVTSTSASNGSQIHD